MTRPVASLKRVAYWSFAPLLCLLLYWHGLRAWFQADDFAWLSLHTQVTNFDTLLSALFRPMAQGTVRPLSERLFFLGFWELFGMDARPFRAFVFLTQFANLTLVAVIMRKLTGSSLAGFVAPALWLASPVLYTPMTWTAAYNQILCSFFLLAAFLLLVLYTEAGRIRYYAAMWFAFLLGFGALELNVVFPAIALLYTLLFARRYVMAVLPMFAVSIAFTLWHRSLGSTTSDPTYAMIFDPRSVANVIWKYIWYAVSSAQAAELKQLTTTWSDVCSVAVLIAIAGFSALMLWQRRWLILFCLGWFFITLAPYLPLANHVSDYYLTIPSIGLAMLGGWAASIAWQAGHLAKLLAALALMMFVAPCAWQARTMTRWSSAKSIRVRNMMQGVASARERFPNRRIVLHGVDDDLYWYALSDRPEIPLRWQPIYLTPETQSAITPVRADDIGRHVLPLPVLLGAIREGKAVVYDVSESRLRNITALYQNLRAHQADEVPSFVDAGSPLFEHLLKSGWHDSPEVYRWAGKRADLQIGVPPNIASPKLRVRGRVAPQHTASSALPVTLYAEGQVLGTQLVPQGALEFDFTYSLPASVVGKPSIVVGIEAARTISTPEDSRPFGVAMGTFAVIP